MEEIAANVIDLLFRIDLIKALLSLFYLFLSSFKQFLSIKYIGRMSFNPRIGFLWACILRTLFDMLRAILLLTEVLNMILNFLCELWHIVIDDIFDQFGWNFPFFKRPNDIEPGLDLLEMARWAMLTLELLPHILIGGCHLTSNFCNV